VHFRTTSRSEPPLLWLEWADVGLTRERGDDLLEPPTWVDAVNAVSRDAMVVDEVLKGSDFGFGTEPQRYIGVVEL
jgi:hypothetical protein